MNISCKGIAILDIAKSCYPYGLEIGFKDEDIKIDMVEDTIKQSIIDVVSYWCSSKAITDGKSYDIRWTSPNTILVTGAFHKGNFKGDLMHRMALTTGYKGFNIGLVKLFYEGYRPKTRRGNGIYQSEAIPLYIKCLYPSYNPLKMVELRLRADQRRIDDIFKSIIETIKNL